MIPGRAMMVLVVLMAAGCADTGGFAKLSRAEQAVFDRCVKPIEPTIGCANMGGIPEMVCLNGGRKDYAAGRTKRARQEWLVANGCPPSMVQPGRYVADAPVAAEAESKAAVPTEPAADEEVVK